MTGDRADSLAAGLTRSTISIVFGSWINAIFLVRGLKGATGALAIGAGGALGPASFIWMIMPGPDALTGDGDGMG